MAKRDWREYKRFRREELFLKKSIMWSLLGVRSGEEGHLQGAWSYASS